jgi:tripartite ATP-independent transporter DctP family solute receptor
MRTSSCAIPAGGCSTSCSASIRSFRSPRCSVPAPRAGASRVRVPGCTLDPHGIKEHRDGAVPVHCDWNPNVHVDGLEAHTHWTWPQYLARVEAVESFSPQVTIELPATASTPRQAIALNGQGPGPLYRWAVFTLHNPLTEPQELVIAAPHQPGQGPDRAHHQRVLELVQIGTIGMTKVSGAALENIVPPVQVFSLPYLFRDEGHRFRVLEGEIGQRLLAESEDKRLVGLAFYDAGSRSFYTKDRPVHRPEDLTGLKIRVIESPTAMRMVSALGGSPTPISWGELYTALQQGVVDGAENNPPSFHTSRHYEVARYYTLDEHTAVPDVLVISTIICERLTPQQQAWIRIAAQESAELQKELWRESTEEALRVVEAAGVTIIRPDKAPFAERVQGLIDTFRADPTLGELVRAIEAHP